MHDQAITRGPAAMWLAVLLLSSVALHAQIALFSFDGTTDSPVGQSFNFGMVADGQVKDVRFHVKNTGTLPLTNVVIGTPQGTGFTLAAVNGSFGQNTIAGGAELEFTIRFTPPPNPALGTYSASLQITSSAPTVSMILLATVAPSAVVTVFPACTSASNGGVTFPAVTTGTTGLCNFSLQNSTSQAITVTVSLTGDTAFQAIPATSTPITLKANESYTFVIQFTPSCGQLSYSATLAISGRPFPLMATALTPPLPRPQLIFDTTRIASAEQHTIGMSLPSAAVCAANGNLNLAFTGAVDDRSVFFLAGSTRTLPFSVKAGDTQILINGSTSASFQTGTTAGIITFSLSGTQIASDATTTLNIAPAPIAIEAASASNQRAGELDVQIVGFDNTYSAGSMLFTFFDTSGNTIGAPIPADFTAEFKTFYAAATTGSAFLVRVSFPVQGDRMQVTRVQVTLANSAGKTQTGSLTFQ
jgi:hypothetical protein